MTHSRLRTVLLVASLTAACSQAYRAADVGSSRTEEQRVLETEDRYVAAELSRDTAALRELVDDRFVLNSRNGTTSGKEALIRSILASSMTGQTVLERTVMIDGNVALIFGTTALRLQRPGTPERISELRYTATYVKRGDRWRMLALHMEPRVRPPQ